MKINEKQQKLKIEELMNELDKFTKKVNGLILETMQYNRGLQVLKMTLLKDVVDLFFENAVKEEKKLVTAARKMLKEFGPKTMKTNNIEELENILYGNNN